METILDNVLTACLTYEDHENHFEYAQSFVNFKLSDKLYNEIKLLKEKYKHITCLNEFTNLLGYQFQLTLMVITDDGKYVSISYGPELYVRINEFAYSFHSNAGKVVKLPAGLGKTRIPIHRLDEILNKTIGKQIKLQKCPLHIHTDFEKLEDEYNCAFHIWGKNGHADFKRVRTSKKLVNPIHLHHDPVTGKLFLILDKKLYFRGQFRLLKTQLE